MGQFAGFVQLGEEIPILQLVKNASGTPVDTTALPLYRVYSPDGALMTNGVGSAAKINTGAITGATNASPIVITSANHGLETGTLVTVSAVGGNTSANGTFAITKVNANTFSLDGSTGNGTYTSGGVWHATGVYSVTIDAESSSGYEKTQTYSVVVEWSISGTVYGDQHTFTVV